MRAFALSGAVATGVVSPSRDVDAPTASSVAEHLQSVDYSTLAACVAELQRSWLPAKVEQTVQVEEHVLALRLRTLTGSAWLYLSWHPAAGHLALSESGPERGSISEAFQFGEQVSKLCRGLVLTNASLPYAWERVIQFSLADRVADPPRVHLFCEIMGRYSNLVAADSALSIVTAGHQVSPPACRQSLLHWCMAPHRPALPLACRLAT